MATDDAWFVKGSIGNPTHDVRIDLQPSHGDDRGRVRGGHRNPSYLSSQPTVCCSDLDIDLTTEVYAGPEESRRESEFEADYIPPKSADRDTGKGKTPLKIVIIDRKYERVVLVAASLFAILVIIVLGVALSVEFPKDEKEYISIADRPPMGWTSINVPCGHLTETFVKEIADYLVTSGLAGKGYQYVVVHDCWQSNRDAKGQLQSDPIRFPVGMEALGGYIHAKGLKFGLYTDAGTLTCNRLPGSFQHEAQDAETFADWGVDLLVNDDCYLRPNGLSRDVYPRMFNALNKTGRAVVHCVEPSLDINGASSVSQVRSVTAAGVKDDWEVMLHMVDTLTDQKLYNFVKQGFWNDPGQLLLGHGGMTKDEYVTQISLWSALKAPLMLSATNTSTLDSWLGILSNRDVIDINQDTLSQSVKLVYSHYTSSGIGQYRVTASRQCEQRSNDRHLRWTYHENTGHVVHDITKKCLTVDMENDHYHYPVVRECSPVYRNEQTWYINSSTNRVILVAYPDLCLAMSTLYDIPARVQNCTDVGIFNPDVRLVNVSVTSGAVPETQYILAGSVGHCLKIRGRPDFQVYLGQLTKNRHVAVLVNRDIYRAYVEVRWADYIADARARIFFRVLDVWRQEVLGIRQSFHVTLDPHTSKTFILTPIR